MDLQLQKLTGGLIFISAETGEARSGSRSSNPFLPALQVVVLMTSLDNPSDFHSIREQRMRLGISALKLCLVLRQP